MPLAGDLRRLKGWAAHVATLGTPNSAPQRAIAAEVGRAVRGVLKQQFSTGTSPTGQPWQPKVNGKPALISKKLPGDFTTSPVAKGVFTTSRIPWLRAHHEGHVFPPRQSAGGHSLWFDQNNRVIKMGRLTKRALRMTFVRESVVRAHLVGRRVLPARPIYPEGAMPAPWAAALNRGIDAGMLKWRAAAQV